ncbi:MAG: oligosaccharide flippase family protein [Clostridia bacterium]|nr:oligosaccharide flippase family protein [Clostridia bacterium]
MKSLFKTVFIIVLFSVITRVIGFLFRIYISRTIGAEALGQYQVSFSVFMVLLTAVSSGLPFIVSRLTAEYRASGNKQSERKMVTASVIIGIVLSLVLCGLVVLFLPVLRKIFADDKCIALLLILLPALVFSAVYSTLRGNLWGQNRYLSLCITELFEQVARVILFIILISGLLGSADGAYVSAISMTGACLLSSILVIIIFFATGGRLKATKDKQIYKTLLKKSTPISGVRLTASLIQPLIALIIPMRLVSAGYTSSQALALYGTAMGMTIPFLYIPSTIIGALSTALVPDLSAALVTNDMQYIKNRIVSAIRFTIFISVIFIPLYMGAGEIIGLFFYDNGLSGILLQQSAWVILPLGLTNITSSLLNSLGYEIKSMKNYVLGAIILILSIWFLPKFVGINSLIIGFGSLFVITSILNIKMLKNIINCKLQINKFLWLSIIFVIPAASICSFVCNLLLNFTTKFFALAISCSLGAIFYIVLCLIFNLIEFNSLAVWLKQKLNKKIFKKRKNKNIARP